MTSEKPSTSLPGPVEVKFPQWDSSLPTQPPDTHPKGYPQREGQLQAAPPFMEVAEGRLPYGRVSGSWVGNEEIHCGNLISTVGINLPPHETGLGRLVEGFAYDLDTITTALHE